MIDVLGIEIGDSDDDLSQIDDAVRALATELGVEPAAEPGETLETLAETENRPGQLTAGISMFYFEEDSSN